MLNKTWLFARKVATSVGGVGCLVIGFCLVAQIFCRTFLGIALSWSEEIAQCGMIFMVGLLRHHRLQRLFDAPLRAENPGQGQPLPHPLFVLRHDHRRDLLDDPDRYQPCESNS